MNNKYTFVINHNKMNSYVEVVTSDIETAKRDLRNSLGAADITNYKFSLIAVNGSFFAESQDTEEIEEIDVDKFYIDLEAWRSTKEFIDMVNNATLDRFLEGSNNG